MGPLKGFALFTAAVLCILYLANDVHADQCDQVEWNTEIAENPFTSRRGKVVLFAFLKGYCTYCLTQASNLERLKAFMASEGYPDIDMLIINGGEYRSSSRINRITSVTNLTVIQDSADHVLYRQIFHAYKDDFLVYDRCGQAAIYIPTPYSDLTRNIVPQVLASVHEGRHNCYCSLDYSRPSSQEVNGDTITSGGEQTDDDDVGTGNERMVGDDPGSEFYRTRNMGRRVLHCAPSDRFCNRFMRQIINRGIGFGLTTNENRRRLYHRLRTRIRRRNHRRRQSRLRHRGQSEQEA